MIDKLEIEQQELFRKLEYPDVAPLLEKCYVRRVEAGEVLVEAGQVNDKLYLILSGRLQVRLLSGSGGIDLHAGESVGEMSIIDDKPTSAQVVALEAGRVLIIPGEYFWDEVVTLPGVVKNLMRLLVKRMRQNNVLALEAHKERLRYEYLQRDLTQARKIQQSMLPKSSAALSRYEQIDIHATVLPAKDIGGDFYDVLPLDEQHFLIAVGDVSGKGMPASLLMVKALVLLRMKCSTGMDLSALAAELNRILCEENEACMYVTLFMALFNTVSGELQYVNAGHNPPLLMRAEQNCGFLDVPSTTPLGLFEQEEYPVSMLNLTAEDTLILYTDGITEAENRAGEFFSSARLCRRLVGTERRFAKHMVEIILDSISKFADGSEQSDDITLLAMHYLGRTI